MDDLYHQQCGLFMLQLKYINRPFKQQRKHERPHGPFEAT